MSHSYVSNLVHYIFSTKEGFPFIDEELEIRLWPYMGGIARENGMRALAIGGTTDHVHTLLSLPARLTVAKAIQLVKGVHRNGSTTNFRSIESLRGKTGTAPSASAHHK